MVPGRRGTGRYGKADQVLELQGLTRRYGEVVALDDLSFTVREGQMFGFVGPNGAGINQSSWCSTSRSRD